MKKIYLNFLFWLLKLESHAIIRKFKPEIIGITGSIAKSSTKEAVFAVLEIKFGQQIYRNFGNLNNELGLPLAILGIARTPEKWQWWQVLVSGINKYLFSKKYPKVLVLEMAADKPGDIDYLLSIVKPRVGIVTAVGPTHLMNFKSVENLAREKAKLVQNLPKNGFAILNEDDSRVMAMAENLKAKVITFRSDGFNLAKNAAKKVAQIYQIDPEKSEQVLKNLAPLVGRFNLLRGVRNSKIIDDAYNSNPLSCSLALDMLAQTEAGRKIAVLGDMMELGSYKKKGHKEIAQKARKIADVLVLVGPNFEFYKKADFWFADSKKAVARISKLVREDDLVLVKGSHSLKMEEVVAALSTKESKCQNLSV